MRTRGAILRQSPGEYEVADLLLDAPRQDELLVRMVASGLCHSDDHFAKGDVTPGTLPWLGGHEGAGIVEEIGPNTVGFAPGNHVVFSFIPSCGQCRWCASGMANLCDFGSAALVGCRFGDPSSFRVTLPDGTPVGQMCGIGTFSEHTLVHALSAVRVYDDVPLETACLLGCGVGAGWGSAVNLADIHPGDIVIVMGAGGLGMNAVQGARHVGADHVLVVDPVALKREKAPGFGATAVYAHISEATEAARALTNGQGADSAIVTVGVTTGEHIGQAFSAIRKGGTVVVAGVGQNADGIAVNPIELVSYQKRIQGSQYGACSPRKDILRQLEMYRRGSLELDALVTRTYALDEIPQAYRDLHDGLILRGVVRM